ncbi:MAG: hypothetical protein ACYC9S_11505 [Leptospirales bacterium]
MSRAHDPGISQKLRGLERRFAILLHFAGTETLSLSIELSAERDLSRLDRARRRLQVGLRPYVKHPALDELVPLAVEEALSQARWVEGGFDPELYGCPVPLFEILELGRILGRIRRSPTSSHASGLALYLDLKCRRFLELRSFRKGPRYVLDPFFLGRCVFFRREKARISFPHVSFPIRCFLLKPVSGFSAPGSYRSFLAAWDATLADTGKLDSWEESARRGALFHEEWRSVFDQSPAQESRSSGQSIVSLDTSSPFSGTPAGPSNWQGNISRGNSGSSHGSGNEPTGETKRKKEESSGLGLESESGDWTRPAEIPFFEPGPDAGEVFPWDTELIRREVEGLLRFLKIGIREDHVDGLTGRLVPRKLSEPTFRVMRRALDPRRPRDLRILAVVDCSLSMTGAPHYYATHLVRVLEESRIGQVFDIVACSTRYLFRLDSRHLNRLTPDETDGFYTLVPFLETISGQYDLSVVLSDCQNSQRSIESLQMLRRKIPTIGCYVLPSSMADEGATPFQKIVDDGRQVFPQAFIHARTFHGLGRRMALYLNGLRRG